MEQRSNILFCAIVLCLLPFCPSFGQSEANKVLYAQAMDYFQKGKYQDAVKAFMTVDSLDRQEMDTLRDSRYGYGKHGAAYSLYKMGEIERAKQADEWFYDIPFVDRRLTATMDSIQNIIGLCLDNAAYARGIELVQEWEQLFHKTFEGPNYVSINFATYKTVLYYKTGDTKEADKIVVQALEDCDFAYPGNTDYKKRLLFGFASNFYYYGSGELFLKYSRVFIDYLRETGELKGEWAEDCISSLAGFAINANYKDFADEMVALFMQVKQTRVGEVSEENFYQLLHLVTVSLQFQELDKAANYLNEAQRISDLLGNEGKKDRHALLSWQQGLICYHQNNYKEARRYIRQTYKLIDVKGENGVEALSGCVSLLMMIHSLEGKTDKGDMEDLKALYERIRDNYSEGTLAIKAIVMMAFISNGNTEGALCIADDIEPYITGNIPSLYLSMYAYILADEYVKARKAGHNALVLINKNLSAELSAGAAKKYANTIDQGLQTIRIKEQTTRFSFDRKETEKYAVSLLKQDLLQAKMRILEQEDSLGCESFMQSFLELERTSRLETKDLVLADSIYNEFAQKIKTRFGEDSEVYVQTKEILEICQFEEENMGVAYALKLADPGTDWYDQKKQEYNEAYAKWKDKELPYEKKAVTASEIELPSLWEMGRTEQKDSIFSLFQKAIETYESHGEADKILETFQRWCYAATLVGKQFMIGETALQLLQNETITNHWKFKEMMACIWIYGGDDAFNQCMQRLQERKDSNVDKMAIEFLLLLPEMIDKHLDYQLKHNLSERWKAAKNEMAARMNHNSAIDSETRLGYEIEQCLSEWKNVYMRHSRTSEVREHFLSLYDKIKQTPSIWKNEQCQKALSVIILESDVWSGNEEFLVIEADSIRKIGISEAKKSQEVGVMSLLRSRFGLSSSSYLSDEQLEDMNRNINYAYIKTNKDKDCAYFLFALDEAKRLYQNDERKFSKRINNILNEMSVHLREGQQDSLTALAYDMLMLSKGYLLRSEQRLMKALQESGNLTVAKEYERYLGLKRRIESSSVQEENLAELQWDAEILYNNLRYKSSAFEDFTKEDNMTWEDIRQALDDDEMAIEYLNRDGWMKALIVRKGYAYPLVKDCGHVDGLKEKGDTIYTQYQSYPDVWGRFIYTPDGNFIYPFEGINTIYFSPAGILNNIAIENMVADSKSDSLMCEKYNIYRLSNTRELIARKKQTKARQKAVVYGDINYDITDADWQLIAQQYKADGQNLMAMREAPKLKRGATGTTLQHLLATRDEVDNITEELRKSSISCSLVTGNDATEDGFKALSGTEPTLLHIATHGFYEQPEEQEKPSYIRQTVEEEKKAETDAMQRTGLFFTGANTWLMGEDIPVGVDDGILTAQEISYLDFTDCDLVTLSACETALGDVKGDGVFGLQRGFKKAGVNAILMTLQSVDDQVTSLLMKAFYHNLYNQKMSKRQALLQAQKQIRTMENGKYAAPRYWAPFILIDALETSFTPHL